MRVNFFRPWTRLFLATAIAATFAALAAGCGASHSRSGKAQPARAGRNTATSGAESVLSALGATGMQIQIKQGTFTGKNQRGVIVWKLYTPLLEAAPGPETVRMRNVVGTLYQDGIASMRVHAPDATIDYKRSTLRLVHGVTGQSITQPEAFSADSAQWQWEQPDGLSATGHVRFQRGATTVTAGKLVGDVSLKSGRLTDHPTVVSPLSSL